MLNKRHMPVNLVSDEYSRTLPVSINNSSTSSSYKKILGCEKESTIITPLFTYKCNQCNSIKIYLAKL